MLDLISELGEVSKEILLATEYGKKKFKSNDEIKTELGDLYYSLITVANTVDVNLDEALEIVLNKYEKRLQKGSPGSENE